MKKILFFACVVWLFASCGTGVYSVSSGKADVATLSFTALEKNILAVEIDGQFFSVESVKAKPYKSGRNIKQTAANSIKVQAGQHTVRVIRMGHEIYNKKLVLSASEHRIIEL